MCAYCMSLWKGALLDPASQLLLIDGDSVLRQTLSEYLKGHGFGVTVASNGEMGLLQAREGDYDLVILDDALPGLSGSEVLRRIRAQGDLPVMMLSDKNDDVDRIVCLELGADDYFSKSCSLRELLARLRSILRRSRQTMALERMRRNNALNLFPMERTATWRGEPLKLTGTEFNLLERLFNSPGRAIRKKELAASVLGREIESYDRSLDMHISNLRKKLGKLADGRSPIQTVHGAGYQLLRK